MAYDGLMWEVEYTDEFELWWMDLDDDEQERLTAAVELLEEFGPALGRPTVDTLERSRHPNMRELRPRGGFLRVLFAFDPRRTAVPLADRLYDEHLATLAEEGRSDE
jgi:hypothetical protein